MSISTDNIDTETDNVPIKSEEERKVGDVHIDSFYFSSSLVTTKLVLKDSFSIWK